MLYLLHIPVIPVSCSLDIIYSYYNGILITHVDIVTVTTTELSQWFK